jgi:hypothetical protein
LGQRSVDLFLKIVNLLSLLGSQLQHLLKWRRKNLTDRRRAVAAWPAGTTRSAASKSEPTARTAAGSTTLKTRRFFFEERIQFIGRDNPIFVDICTFKQSAQPRVCQFVFR